MTKIGSDFEFEILSDEKESAGERQLPTTNTDSPEYLSALWDSLVDELRAEELCVADEPESERERPQVLPESAASVEETLMDDVHQRLLELLPRIEARAEEGVEFDEELYQELKPLFAAILGPYPKAAELNQAND